LLPTVKKSNTEFKAESLSEIDNEICKHFGVTSHNITYHASWYDIIGFDLATSKSFQEIIAKFKAIETDKHLEHLIEIAKWLDEHYVSNHWYQHHK